MALQLNPQGIPTWYGKEIHLPPKERSVLALLLESYPDPISKDALIQRVWLDNRTVSDDSLVRCISQIRKVLPEIRIEPIYGYGYRLLYPKLAPLEKPGHTLPASVAMDQYLHASSLAQQHTNKSLKQAIFVFHSLVADYPDFVEARLALARTIIHAINIGVDKEISVTQANAEENIQYAEKIHPATASVLSARAWLLDARWRFLDSEWLHLEALKKAPDNADVLHSYALHLLATGRMQDAVFPLKRVLSLRPFSIHARTLLARALGLLGRYDEAMEQIVIAEEHESLMPGPIIEGVKLLIQAASDPGEQLIAIAERLDSLDQVPPYARVLLPYVLVRCGHPERALEIARARLADSSIPVYNRIFLVRDLAAVGELDIAAHILQEAYRQHHGYLPFILHCPEIGALAQHPIFKDIHQRLFAGLEAGKNPTDHT